MEHPFVVNVMKIFHNDRRIFILMEFVNGGELFRLIHHNRPRDVNVRGLSPELVSFFGAEIVITIKHLHEKNVIYRDLKPENVLLDSAGHIKTLLSPG